MCQVIKLLNFEVEYFKIRKDIKLIKESNLKTEFEIRFLEINEKEILEKLKDLNASEIGNWLQVRKTYDLVNPQKNSWVRLRTNGQKTTLTIKEILTNKVDGTKELEIEVSDFSETDAILNKIGLTSRNFQENKRRQFKYKNVEIDIDTWPLIPTYLEIEGENEESIKKACIDLGLNYDNSTTMDVTDIYKNVYDIDILKIKNLTFSES